MIDLETMGVTIPPKILTFAAVPFNPENKIVMTTIKPFYHRIDVKSYLPHPTFLTDSSTEQWWTTQSKEAQQEVFGGTESVEDVIKSFSEWMQQFDSKIKVWSQGAAFDVVIVEKYLQYFGREIPWKFWNVRDTRTLYDFAGIHFNSFPKTTKYPAHHALGDCINQIEAVTAAYAKK